MLNSGSYFRAKCTAEHVLQNLHEGNIQFQDVFCCLPFKPPDSDEIDPGCPLKDLLLRSKFEDLLLSSKEPILMHN